MYINLYVNFTLDAVEYLQGWLLFGRMVLLILNRSISVKEQVLLCQVGLSRKYVVKGVVRSWGSLMRMN